MTQTPPLQTIQTPREPVVDTYHGVAVTDDYRWLEDSGSEQTKAWSEAQNRRSRAYLAGLSCHEAVRRRAEEILKVESTEYDAPQKAGRSYLALKEQPPKQQPFLVTMSSLDDLSDERVLVDPNLLDDDGATTIDWYSASPDGRLVAVSLSAHGTESGTLHVYDTATGESVGAEVPRVHGGTAGGSLAWASDSSGFWYTRYPSPGERPDDELDFFQDVWFHPLGDTLEKDRRELGKLFADNRIAESFLSASPDGQWVLDRVQKGDGGEWEIFARPQAEERWWQVAAIDDKCVYATFGPDSLYLLSRRDTPHGEVLRLPLVEGAVAADAVVVVPSSDVTIEGMELGSPSGGGIAVTDDRLWLLDMDGGSSSVRVYGLQGESVGVVEVPPVSAIDCLVRLDGDEVAWVRQSFVEPGSWWIAGSDSVPRRSALVTETPLNFSGLEVRREFATSDDGTQVPISVVCAHGAPRDGTVPTLLTGYGGYGIVIKPWFQAQRLLWLEQGGAFAVAHVRGGGEYGEAWHHAGRLAAKQNVFDDFAACARHLVDSGLTSVDRLAIMGGSNGGLLMGAVLTQHPDIAKAVVARVPVLDMLRVELHPNGAFNVTEFGTVQDPVLFEAMYAYSPYHRIIDETSYPAVLLTAGEFDPRVDAYHAKKMAARLQAATSSDEPILLRIESGGHGMGQSLDQAVSEATDIHAFLFDRLGVDYPAAATSR